MYPDVPRTQVIVGSMNMGYISDTARDRTQQDLFRHKREPIPQGHSDGRQVLIDLGLVSPIDWSKIMDWSKIRRKRSKTRVRISSRKMISLTALAIREYSLMATRIKLWHKFLALAPLPQKYHHGRTQLSSQSQLLRTFEFVLHFLGCDTVTVSPNQIIIIIVIIIIIFFLFFIIIIILQWHIHLVKSRCQSAKYKKIIDPAIQRNEYFAHPENLLLAMISDYGPSTTHMRAGIASNNKGQSYRPQ